MASDLLTDLQTESVGPVTPPPASHKKKRKRKKREPLSGWPFIAVTTITVLPFGMMLSCLCEPILPKHQAALWEPIACLVIGAATIAAVEILWKDA